MNLSDPFVLGALAIAAFLVYRRVQANRAAAVQPVAMQAAELRVAAPAVSTLEQAILDMHDAEDRARRLAAVPHTVASLGKHEAVRRATGQVEAYSVPTPAPAPAEPPKA
jgi:hypothetical protein